MADENQIYLLFICIYEDQLLLSLKYAKRLLYFRVILVSEGCHNTLSESWCF